MTLEKYSADKHFEILKNWYMDKSTLTDMGLESMSEDELYEWLNEPDRIHLLFFQDEVPIGCVNFYHYKTNFPNYEIGYLVDKAFQGKGIATEMVRESLEYAKSVLKVGKIEETYVKGSNISSKRVLEKNGFQLDKYNEEKDKYYFSKVLKSSTDLVSQHFELLKGTLFTDIVELPTYNLVKGFLTDSIWNYVIPKTISDKVNFNEIETVINKYKEERDFSIYVPVELQNDYDKFLLSKGYKLESVDTYIFRKLDSEFSLSLEGGETFEEVTSESYEDYLAQAKLAFQEWENEEHYTNMFYKLGNKFEDKELRNFIIRNSEDIICFGSVIYSKSLNLAYFHNSGSNPKYRRKGYFTKLKGFMCDYIYLQGVDRVYALVEENGGSHKALSQTGFKVNTKYYIYARTDSVT